MSEGQDKAGENAKNYAPESSSIIEQPSGWRAVVAVGDIVQRSFGSGKAMGLVVSEVDDKFIHCGGWKFDRDLGYEVDEEIGWGVKMEDGSISPTGSFLVGVQKPRRNT
jgi:hypothetical protein